MPWRERQHQSYLSVWTSASSLCRVPILYFDLSGTYCIITGYSPEIMSNSGDSLSRRTKQSMSASAFYTRHGLQCSLRAKNKQRYEVQIHSCVMHRNAVRMSRDLYWCRASLVLVVTTLTGGARLRRAIKSRREIHQKYVLQHQMTNGKNAKDEKKAKCEWQHAAYLFERASCGGG